MSLFIGLETTNPDSLRGAGKQFNKTESYGELFGMLRGAGIVPCVSLILGFDEDSPDQPRQLAAFVREWQLSFPILWILTPAPTTPLYEQLEAEGRLHQAPWSHFDGTHVVFQTKTPEDELAEAYWRCFREAYSLRNSFAAVATNVRNARRKGPELLRSVFIQGLFRSNVLRKQHPLSGGFGRIVP